jgi:hypothetical protein
MATESGLYNTLVLSTTNIIPEKKIHDSLKLLALRPALYILTQKNSNV